MSYNIDTWEQIACSLTLAASLLDDNKLRIVKDVDYGRPTANGESDVMIRFDVEDGKATGKLANDVVTIDDLYLRGEGSGRSLDRLKVFLKHTSGAYTAVLVWEGGDSITLLSVQDGAVTNKDLDIPALLRENAELKERLAALEKQGEEL